MAFNFDCAREGGINLPFCHLAPFYGVSGDSAYTP
jgi:hypothetical protein